MKPLDSLVYRRSHEQTEQTPLGLCLCIDRVFQSKSSPRQQLMWAVALHTERPSWAVALHDIFFDCVVNGRLRDNVLLQVFFDCVVTGRLRDSVLFQVLWAPAGPNPLTGLNDWAPASDDASQDL